MSRGPMPDGGEAAHERRAEEEVVDDPQVVAADADDVATLDAGNADDVLEDLVVVARIAGRAEVVRVAAEAGDVRLEFGVDAVCAGPSRCRACCS